MNPTTRPTREQYWRQVHLADALLRHVQATGDPSLAWRRLPELADAFGDDEAVLTHLAARWSRDLAGSLDPVLDLPDELRERATANVAARIAARRPALHAVLLRHADHPAVARARARDRALAGLVDAPVHAEHVRPRGLGVVGALTAVWMHCPVVRAVRASDRSRVSDRSRAETARAA